MEDIQGYLANFIEEKHEVFNGLPVCPFAKKERLENRIKFVECSFSKINVERIIAETELWLSGDFSTLLYIDKGDASIRETVHFYDCITALLKGKGVNLFLFHEDSVRNFGGLYTRRSPRPFIMAGYKQHIGKNKKKLLKTKYYSLLTDKEYDTLNSKRKRKNAKNRESNSENS